MAWQGWKAAAETLVFNDVTSDLSIHGICYWMPVLVGHDRRRPAAAVVMIFAQERAMSVGMIGVLGVVGAARADLRCACRSRSRSPRAACSAMRRSTAGARR